MFDDIHIEVRIIIDLGGTMQIHRLVKKLYKYSFTILAGLSKLNMYAELFPEIPFKVSLVSDFDLGAVFMWSQPPHTFWANCILYTVFKLQNILTAVKGIYTNLF
jgi:hypothetical protein